MAGWREDLGDVEARVRARGGVGGVVGSPPRQVFAERRRKVTRRWGRERVESHVWWGVGELTWPEGAFP